MARHWQKVWFLVLAVGMFSPTTVFAQKVGNLWVENNTNTTIRIGCAYYVDANGQTVNLDAFWDLAPGQYAQRANGQTIVAKKFVFFIITPEGESAGWNVTNVTAFGNLYCSINNQTLATHKNQAGAAILNYPPLAAKVQQGNNIVAKQNRLRALNLSIPLGRTALGDARRAYNKLLMDPNATQAQIGFASGAIFAAELALNALIDERAGIENYLRSMGIEP